MPQPAMTSADLNAAKGLLQGVWTLFALKNDIPLEHEITMTWLATERRVHDSSSNPCKSMFLGVSTPSVFS